jgi:ATP-dependent phosphoenolpyruvate carboxykinase
LHPAVYAEMLAEKVKKYKTNVWLINTGWSGGKYGVGKVHNIFNFYYNLYLIKIYLIINIF